MLPLITKFLQILVFIIAISSDVVKAANNRGVKAIILYTYDDSTTGSSVVTMEVDKNKFMSVIQDTQSNTKDAKPLKFVQNNGFFDLLEGDSSQFSFMTTNGMADCDCKCLRRPIITTRTTPTTTKKPECPNGKRLPYCCENDANNINCELPTRPTTPPPFVSKKDTGISTAAPTYLPPTTTSTLSPCPLGGSGPFCCPNGANNIDCCLNNGRGPHCCLNNGVGPNCCTNGGSGKYCCLDGSEDSPDCKPRRIETKTTTTQKPIVYTTTTTRASPPVFTTTTTQRTQVFTTTTTPRPQVFTTTTTRKPECPNGKGRLPYCCENGAQNANCELPTRPTPLTTKKVFRGPTYLPVARVTTERPATTTQTYTYGSRPTFTYRFSFTNGAWTYVPRSTSYTTRATTTTAKYAYDQPINGINYSGADNSL
ncbi:hypothetical protein PVAND_009848 [Polypedilum vanderplanki]|uniref:Uncharacterized protein n=1 Tax=Polypedilum vanderplanki TaxID=319348 RepID=A0A9J6CDT3_POLVA|nr:hypothetical protein PVAND_009848 [Polypedilum vanderplanki]